MQIYAKKANLQTGPEKKRAVPIAEEAETVAEGIVVDGPPVPADKGGNEEYERALRLMEVRHQHIDDTETESGDNDDARIAFELVKPVFIQILHYGSEGFLDRIGILPGVGAPLLHGSGLSRLDTGYTYIIKGLQSADRSRPDRYNFFVSLND